MQVYLKLAKDIITKHPHSGLKQSRVSLYLSNINGDGLLI